MKLQIMENKTLRFALAVLLIFALLITPISPWNNAPAVAKTADSPPADTLFFYVKNSAGQDVLLKTYSLDELEGMAHKNPATGSNYCYSATDNYPSVVYTEARGFTSAELVAKVKADSAADNIGFTGADKLDLMATDGGGLYSKSWTFSDLSGQQGYYYPGIFKSSGGWTSAWEVAGSGFSSSSWPPMPLATYLSNHKASDSTYAAKEAVSNGGIEMPAIFAVESEGDRVSYLETSYNVNRNNITGALNAFLNRDRALTLCLPQTSDVLFSGNRTMYHYCAWIYNIRLDMATDPIITPVGDVAAPTATITDNSASNSEVLIDFDCETTGAAIYYSLEKGGAPTLKYTPGVPVRVDVSNRDIKADPIRVYYSAVKEGWTDKGIVSTTWPERAPALNNATASFLGQDVTLSAFSPVDPAAWQAWATLFADGNRGKAWLKTQSGNTWQEIPAGRYDVDAAAGTITIDAGQFPSAGGYNLRFAAEGYTYATATAQLKQQAPQLTTEVAVYYGDKAMIPVGDSAYLTNISGLTIKEQGASGAPSIINAGAYAKFGSNLVLNTGSIPQIGETAAAYTVEIIAPAYEPTSQRFTLKVNNGGDASGNSFAYGLSAAKTAATVGEAVGITASLTSGYGPFTFYAGEYRLKITGNLTVTDIAPANGWEYGLATSGADTILTFAKIDTTGNGLPHAATSAIGTFHVTGRGAGTGAVAVTSALLTDEYAFSRNRVSGTGLSIAITERQDDNGGTGTGGGDIGGGGVGNGADDGTPPAGDGATKDTGDKGKTIKKFKVGTVKISGTARVGKKLKVKLAKWSPKPKYTYQWFANGKKIKGATKATFKLTKACKGKKITVKITAKKAGYQTITKTTKATGKVKR